MSQIQVRSSLNATVNGQPTFRATKGGFTATQRNTSSGTTGNVPGGLVIATTGTDITFPGMVQPGLCEIVNFDAVNTIVLGIKDIATGKFYPLADVWAQEQYIVRLSSWLGKELFGTGTGTIHGATSVLHAIAEGAPIGISVRAIET